MPELFSTLFAVPSFGLNILDFIIIFIILFYAFEGYTLGFVGAFFDLLSFISSFILALLLYGLVGSLLIVYTALPQGFANAIGFFLVALVAEFFFSFLFRFLMRKIPRASEDHPMSSLQTTNHIFGLVPGIASALIILAFIFSVIVSLPSSPYLKNLVTESKIGSRLIVHTASIEGVVASVFGGAFHETLNFLTVAPRSDETLNLRFSVQNATIDTRSEEQMLVLVNQEREKQDLRPLVMNESLRNLARNYSNDMLRRGYFSHNNPEGQSPFDRMEEAEISFVAAGENLALAPSVELAMQGLMNSPGHRANILSPNFARVGIGVMDGGVYGKMFTQVFTD